MAIGLLILAGADGATEALILPPILGRRFASTEVLITVSASHIVSGKKIYLGQRLNGR